MAFGGNLSKGFIGSKLVFDGLVGLLISRLLELHNCLLSIEKEQSHNAILQKMPKWAEILLGFIGYLPTS